MTDKEKNTRVIKDCWVEDRLGKLMEHEIIERIKQDMKNDGDFHKYFIDICGYQKTPTSGGFHKLCKNLETRTFAEVDFNYQHLVPTDVQKAVYHTSAEDRIPDQAGYLLQTLDGEPQVPPNPRFRYQVVYKEKGISLFEVLSFADVFKYIVQAADGMSQAVLNSRTHSHYTSAPPLTPSRVGAQRFYAGKCHCGWDDSEDFGL